MAGDSLFDNVVLLLPCDGANNGTTFEDRSKTPKTITVGGNAKTSTTQAKYGNASAYFDGAGDYLSVADNNELDLGTGDFTIEFWVYSSKASQTNNYPRIAVKGAHGQANAWNIVLTKSSGLLAFETYDSSTVKTIYGIGTLVDNAWNHIAVTRSSGTVRTYLTGVLQASGTDTRSLTSTYNILIGAESASTSAFVGYIDDFRITSGQARYTGSSFTPAQCAVGYQSRNDSYFGSVVTYLLADGSHGATSTSDLALNPITFTFNSGAAESFTRSRVGNGSINLTAASSYLSAASTSRQVFGTGDFCIDAWVYVTAAGAIKTICSKGSTTSAGWVFAISAANLLTFTVGSSIVATGATTLTASTWYHLAVTRDSGNVWLYVNGVRDASGTDSTNLTDTGDLRIGRARSTDTNYLASYIDSFRITGASRGWGTTLDVPYYEISGMLADQGQIYLTGEVPSFSYQVRATPVQGTLLLQGQQADVTRAYEGTPSIGDLKISGQTPKIPTPYYGYATQGTLALTGRNPSLSSAVTTVSYGSVTGRGFNTLPEISLSLTDAAYITGYGFSTAPELFGGAEVSGSAFASEVSIELTPANEFSVIGYGFSTGLSAELIPDFASGVTGRGFSTSPAIYGGAEITGRGFSSELITQTETPLSIVVSGRGFATEFDAAIIAPTSISVTGYGFSSSLQYTDISGRGFLSQPLIEFEYTVSYAEAFVMNLAHKEMPVTRYTNYPFMHVARIGDKHYGFATDGIYELTGDYDLVDTVPVNGTATTQETDFGIFQSKNVPFVYLSADTDSTVTPIVDGEAQPSQTTDFSGRKCKLARGSKGRYWAMRIENITNLQGLEFLPDALQRRVK